MIIELWHLTIYFYTMEYNTYVNNASMAIPNLVSLPIPLASDPKQLGKAKFGLLACQVSGLMFIIVLDFLSSLVCPKGEQLNILDCTLEQHRSQKNSQYLQSPSASSPTQERSSRLCRERDDPVYFIK